MRVLGVDPGISGGLAVVEITDGAAPVLVECIDIPVVGAGAKERVDVAAVRNFIDQHDVQHAFDRTRASNAPAGQQQRFQIRAQRSAPSRRRSR